MTSPAGPMARAEFSLPRDAPTQSGAALPKYHAWVRILALASPVRSSCFSGHPLTLQPAGNSSATHLEDA